MSKHKPCPFCKHEFSTIYAVEEEFWAVQCFNCHARGPKKSTTDEALKAWNFAALGKLTRKDAEKLVEALENPLEPNEALRKLMKGRL